MTILGRDERMTQSTTSKYFAPDGGGKARIEEVYLRNSTLNQIIVHLKINRNPLDSKAADLEVNSNLEKKRKRIFDKLGVDQKKYKDDDSKRNRYSLETAAILIAFFLFPPRAKDTLPMQVMQERIREVSGEQLLAFLHLASEISLILFRCLPSGSCTSGGEDLYAQKVADQIRKYLKEHKRDTDVEDKRSFGNIYYHDDSKRFNELVMYANIKAAEDALHKELAEMTDCFMKGLFVYREDRDDVDDLLDALDLVDISDHLDELDVHTAICTYSNKMTAYSKKLEDVITVWKRIVTSQEWGEIKAPLVSKDEIFALLTVYFDHPHDLFHSVYEAIRLENPEDYQQELYKAGLSYILAYCQMVNDAYVVTRKVISVQKWEQRESKSVDELTVLLMPTVVSFLDSPYLQAEGLSVYRGIKEKYPEEYLEKLTDVVITNCTDLCLE